MIARIVLDIDIDDEEWRKTGPLSPDDAADWVGELISGSNAMDRGEVLTYRIRERYEVTTTGRRKALAA